MKITPKTALALAADPKLSDGDHRILLALIYFLGDGDPQPVSPTRISDTIKRSRGYVARSITRLHKAGYLEEGGRLGQYRSFRVNLD